ncbi:MAG: DUF2156 domain-containing protein [Alphaproteobacteria bacterium]|nr:DUF2156 domain-containing protein [Alphaproteobacteria bacterium]
MPTLPDRLDRLLRALLALPGAVVEALDGTHVQAPAGRADAVVDRVRRGARHPEAYLALEDGIHHTVVDGDVIGWEHRGRTAFAVGGLNAAHGRKGALLAAWVDHTRARGIVRQLAFPVRPDELDEARAVGFTPVQVGIEAWIDLPGFTLQGGRFAHVRQMRNRSRRRGVEVVEVDVGVDAVRDALAAVHAAWLASKRPSWRMKLLVGSPCLDRPYDRRYVVARSSRGVEAFVTVVPGAPGEHGVDVMARRPDAPAGVMEHLICEVATALRDEGATGLSLGPCPMAGVPITREHPLLTRVFRLLYATELGNRVFGFRRLVAFKDKFRPRWAPVYFVASPHLGVWALYRGCRMWGLY